MLNFKKSYLQINAGDPQIFLMILSQGGAYRLCDKIMGENFRAVFLQYGLLKLNNVATYGLKAAHALLKKVYKNDFSNFCCLEQNEQSKYPFKRKFNCSAETKIHFFNNNFL